MYRIATALVLATVGCATTSGGEGRREREGNASLTGAVWLPPSGMPPGASPCAGLKVQVTYADAPSDTLGQVMVKQSRQRCLYVVSHLPSDAALQLTVTPGAWRCEGGEAPSLSPQSATLTLRDYETATRDVRATCGK